jgi:hypothetical protein
MLFDNHNTYKKHYSQVSEEKSTFMSFVLVNPFQFTDKKKNETMITMVTQEIVI